MNFFMQIFMLLCKISVLPTAQYLTKPSGQTGSKNENLKLNGFTKSKSYPISNSALLVYTLQVLIWSNVPEGAIKQLPIFEWTEREREREKER